MIFSLKKYWPIVLITFFALGLRVYKLGQFPVGFLWDEAALGYNAYSILKTGKDEYGQLFPIIFKSFGDYKPGFYVYLTIPSILLFGLNEFAVRMPSALFGTLTVLIMYLLVKECVGENGLTRRKRISADTTPLIAALLVAISPWHINFSRGAWELNVMLFEILLGFYLLIKSLKKRKKKWLYFSSLIFITPLLTYQAAKFLVPILLVGFLFFFRKELVQIKLNEKKIFLIIFFSGYLIFNLLTLLGGKAGRIKTMSIFSYPRSTEETEMILKQDNKNNFLYQMFHGAPIFFLRSVLGRYFNHFSGKFLFITGDWSNPRNGTIYQGVLYYADFLFVLLGLVALLGKNRKPLENFMIYWLTVAPIPAALTRDSISSVRSYTMVIPLIFIAAFGLTHLTAFLQKQKPVFRYFIFTTIILIYVFFFIRFLDLYFVHDPIFSSEDRLYGYKQAIEYLVSALPKKEKIILTQKYGQPYIFYLFYTAYDPKKYQKQAKLKENLYGDVGEIEKIDNIYFRKIYFPNDRAIPDALLVGDEFELPTVDINQEDSRFKFVKQINFLNSKTAFRIIETR